MTHIGGFEHHAQVRQPNGRVGRKPIFDECNMDCPILAPRCEFFGAVKWVNDPHPILLQAGWIIGCFLGEEPIARSVLLKHAGNPVLCQVVARFTQLTPAKQSHPANAFQNLSSALRNEVG